MNLHANKWSGMALVGALLLSVFLGIVALSAREETPPKIEAVPLLTAPLQGEPGKEVDVQVYTFPPGSATPWHIHPDAHEIAYILQGTLTFERDGEAPVEIKAGETDYLPPNVVHRGSNKGSEPVKLYVVRIKPVGKPLTETVER